MLKLVFQCTIKISLVLNYCIIWEYVHVLNNNATLYVTYGNVYVIFSERQEYIDEFVLNYLMTI